MSLTPSINADANIKNKFNNNILFAARVKDILLDDKSKLFSLNGWNDIGLIEFKPLYNISDNNNSLLLAKPLSSNIKNYPLKEELVLIINAPSYELNDNPNVSDFYYIPFPINIWNNINHNSLPNIEIYNNNPRDLIFGNNFEEKDDIKSLLPEEGDIIIEGRFGHSIRFSSTNKNSNNSWSSNGNNGDPIIVIRNNQYKEDNEPWIPIKEDINKDGSSIYMTSNQEIPLDLACTNLKTLDIVIAKNFNPSLQIIDKNQF
jgi:hypothetical protein